MTWDGRKRPQRPQAGRPTVTVTGSAGNFNGTLAVTFDPPFAATPAIVVSPGTTGAGVVSATPSGQSETGFTINVHRTDSAADTPVAWQAMAVTQ